MRYKDQPSDQAILVIPKFKIFWTRKFCPGQRVTYFTSLPNDPAIHYEAKTALRAFDADAHIVKDDKQHSDRRQNLLKQYALIEKPKGVDCALIVRVLEDAQQGMVDVCNLFTSDADYVPLIDAVRRRGIQVIVHGFRNGLGYQSAMDYEPDRFVDLEQVLRTECVLASEGS